MNGGYSMIDFSGLDLNNPGTIPGIYERAKNAIATGKPLVLSGIVNDEQTFSPMVAYGGAESETSVFVSFYPVTLHISNADEITI